MLFDSHHNVENSNNTIELHWCLEFYPSGKEESDNEFISIYLVNCNDFEVMTKYSIKMEVAHSSTLTSVTQQKIFSAKCEGENSQVSYVDKESIFSKHSDNLLDDTLTIYCSVFDTSLRIDNQESSKDIHLTTLNSFEHLLESGKFSDVTFNIGEKKLKGHRAFLSTASEVFQAMFDHEMTEQQEGVVNIVDIDFDIMKEMFRFIYARKVNNINKNACDLLVAADKYCIKGLKELCEKTLCQKLNVENALQYLELAIQYNAMELKSEVLEFAVKKLKNIVTSEEFKSLSSESRGELLLYIACNQKKEYYIS